MCESRKVLCFPLVPETVSKSLYLAPLLATGYVFGASVGDVTPISVKAEQNVVGCERLQITGVVGEVSERTRVYDVFNLYEQSVQLRIC